MSQGSSILSLHAIDFLKYVFGTHISFEDTSSWGHIELFSEVLEIFFSKSAAHVPILQSEAYR